MIFRDVKHTGRDTCVVWSSWFGGYDWMLVSMALVEIDMEGACTQ